MFDTVALNHVFVNQPNSEGLLSRYWLERYSESDRTIDRFIQNAGKGNNKPRLTIYRTRTGEWCFNAECSLPKLLRGVNVPPLDESEIQESLRLFSSYAEKQSGIVFNSETALLSRVDFTKDIKIGESNIVPTIAKFMRVQIPKYDRQVRNDTTVIFTPKGENNSKRIIIYGKYAEVLQKCGSEAEQQNAKGILRVEVRLRTRAINYLIEKRELPNREARNILTTEVADFVLEDALKLIQFENVVDRTANNTFEKLLACFGLNRAKSLLGFLAILKQFGEDFHKLEWLNYPRRTYFKDLADCRKAGVLPYD